MCTAGPPPAPDPRGDGKQAEDLYLPEEVLAEPGELPEVDRRAREGQWGEGACPPTPLPGPAQLWLPEMSFVYSQETRLPASREKGFFTGA